MSGIAKILLFVLDIVIVSSLSKPNSVQWRSLRLESDIDTTREVSVTVTPRTHEIYAGQTKLYTRFTLYVWLKLLNNNFFSYFIEYWKYNKL